MDMPANTPGKIRSNLVRTVTVLLLLALAACGNDAAGEVTTTSTEPEAETLEVKALDYEFADLPDEIAAGTTLTLANESEAELHELVAIRLPEDETRSVEELVADPEALASYFPSVSTVLIAPPASGSVAVEGTGTLDEPGRYAIICAIPTGADPDEYMAAAAEAEGGPPEVDGGPPHFAVGMYAEVTVEG